MQFNFLNYEEVQRRLNAMSDFKVAEFVSFVGEEALAVTEEAFQNEKDPVTGEKWEKSYRAQEKGGQTLTDTARLRRSLTYEAMSNGTVAVGTTVKYAKQHNEGEKYGRRGFIQRRFLGLPDNFVENVMNDSTVKRMLRME